ncbi:MAG: DUF4838 domain-containing protein, partial [Victivallales bacterium]|nr:DUF4838 domain-containing protein [Victivallales bacterium]
VDFEVVLPEHPAAYELKAREELLGHLAKMPLESMTVGGVKPVFHIGATDAAKAVGFANLAQEEHVICSDGGRLILAGGGTRGTLYAVYSFLEELGVLWLAPDCTIIPQARQIELKPFDKKVRRPFFTHRSIIRCGGGTIPVDNGQFVVRNKLNFDASNFISSEFGDEDGFGSPHYAHCFEHYFSGKEHDGLRAIVGGKRVGIQPCLSNPQLPELIYGKLVKHIEETESRCERDGRLKPRLYDLSICDGSYRCECDACEKALKGEGGAMALMLNVLNPVADKLSKTHPAISIQTIGYCNLLPPPPKGTRVAPNIIVVLCDTQSNQAMPSSAEVNRAAWADVVEKWQELTTNVGIWDYGITYTFTGFPYPGERALVGDMKYYADRNIKFQFWEVESPELSDMHELKVWMLMKLMEDPYRDANALYERFMDGYYGAASATMKRIRDVVAAETAKARSHIDWYANQTMFKHLNAKSLLELERLFDEAEREAAGTPTLLARVKRARLGTDRACYVLYPYLMAELVRNGGRPEEYPIKRQDVINRFRGTRLAEIEKLKPRWGRTKKEMCEEVERELDYYSKMPTVIKPPSKFADSVYFDFPAINAYNYKDRAKRISDADSELGEVLRLDVDEEEVGDKVDKYYGLPLDCGIWDNAKQKGFAQNCIRSVPNKDWNWYKILTVNNLPDGGELYMTGSWVIQFNIGNPTPGLDQTYDVWASLKFSGPKYFPGDTGRNSIFFERVVLVPVK